MVTASLVVPSIVHVIDYLKNIKPHTSVLKKMCMQFEQSINKRFIGIVKRLSQQNVDTDDPFSDPIYFVCTVFDPKFKFYGLSHMDYKPIAESQTKQSSIQMILDECDQNIHMSLGNMQSSSSSTFIVNSYTIQSIGTMVIKNPNFFNIMTDLMYHLVQQ